MEFEVLYLKNGGQKPKFASMFRTDYNFNSLALQNIYPHIKFFPRKNNMPVLDLMSAHLAATDFFRQCHVHMC